MSPSNRNVIVAIDDSENAEFAFNFKYLFIYLFIYYLFIYLFILIVLLCKSDVILDSQSPSVAPWLHGSVIIISFPHNTLRTN